MKLYNYFRSGTSHRTRIALELKGVQAEYIAVDLLHEEHLKGNFHEVNPQALVPALVLNDGTAQPASQTLTFGSVASGAPTTLNLGNVGGAGAATTGNGILVATVTGASPADAFVLAGPGYLDQGGFRYTLQQVGSNWYLQSARAPVPAAVNPVPTLGQYAQGLLALSLALLAGWRLRQRRG